MIANCNAVLAKASKNGGKGGRTRWSDRDRALAAPEVPIMSSPSPAPRPDSRGDDLLRPTSGPALELDADLDAGDLRGRESRQGGQASRPDSIQTAEGLGRALSAGLPDRP